MYPFETIQSLYTDWFYVVRYIELVAAFVELFAAIGWTIQWQVCFINDFQRQPDTTIGRGFTLDDPDCWANITLIMAASYYLYYNIRVLKDYNYYETSDLYETADQWYFANAILYTICSLRDCDFFWFMPAAGRFPNIIHMALAHVNTYNGYVPSSVRNEIYADDSAPTSCGDTSMECIPLVSIDAHRLDVEDNDVEDTDVEGENEISSTQSMAHRLIHGAYTSSVYNNSSIIYNNSNASYDNYTHGTSGSGTSKDGSNGLFSSGDCIASTSGTSARNVGTNTFLNGKGGSLHYSVASGVITTSNVMSGSTSTSSESSTTTLS